MPAVLLHGVPETPVIWVPLVAHLDRTDVVCLQLPGFGGASPDGWGATKEDYTGWLIGQLEAIGEPVDLVGHDWGGGFAPLAVAQRPDLVRSWASDLLGLFHPDYVWHDVARIWQTPGAGEQYFEQMLAMPVGDVAALYESIGIPAATAGPMAAAADAEMGRCILALYRSAAQPEMARCGAALGPAATRPGLAIIAPDDPYTRGDGGARAMAARLGARIHELPGQGHWWMLGDPAAGAAMLTEFWGSL